jgi:hypothetical protein
MAAFLDAHDGRRANNRSCLRANQGSVVVDEERFRQTLRHFHWRDGRGFHVVRLAGRLHLPKPLLLVARDDLRERAVRGPRDVVAQFALPGGAAAQFSPRDAEPVFRCNRSCRRCNAAVAPIRGRLRRPGGVSS